MAVTGRKIILTCPFMESLLNYLAFETKNKMVD